MKDSKCESCEDDVESSASTSGSVSDGEGKNRISSTTMEKLKLSKRRIRRSKSGSFRTLFRNRCPQTHRPSLESSTFQEADPLVDSETTSKLLLKKDARIKELENELTKRTKCKRCNSNEQKRKKLEKENTRIVSAYESSTSSFEKRYGYTTTLIEDIKREQSQYIQRLLHENSILQQQVESMRKQAMYMQESVALYQKKEEQASMELQYATEELNSIFVFMDAKRKKILCTKSRSPSPEHSDDCLSVLVGGVDGVDESFLDCV